MSDDPHPLRLILDRQAGGAWNMSVDQALLDSAENSGVPVLRFYTWSPATLSLGYFQPAGDRHQHPESRTCPLVRRASGGGAILHDHEITYSLCIPGGNRWANRNTEIYASIHDCIISVLKNWGVAASSWDRAVVASKTAASFLCFQRRASGDLILDGHKIVGSAQRRSKKAILQHGSILFRRSEFAPRLPGILDLTDANIRSDEFLSLFTDAICQKLQLSARPDCLGRIETKLAEQIEGQRFGNDDWNLHRNRI